MDTSLIWEKVNGQGLVNFRNLMDSHFNFLYPQNNIPLSPSTNMSYHGRNLFDIEWMLNFDPMHYYRAQRTPSAAAAGALSLSLWMLRPEYLFLGWKGIPRKLP